MTESLYRAGYIRTFSGQYVNLVNPKADTIYPIDIAVHLARECRFSNATKKIYSVAEHSVWCMLKAERDYPGMIYLPFIMLMHDAHEYLWRDMATPAKELLTGYKVYADMLQVVINDKFNVRISPEENEVIKRIDLEALEWEWDNKVLDGDYHEPAEKNIVETFLYHFVRLCKVSSIKLTP